MVGIMVGVMSGVIGAEVEGVEEGVATSTIHILWDDQCRALVGLTTVRARPASFCTFGGTSFATVFVGVLRELT